MSAQTSSSERPRRRSRRRVGVAVAAGAAALGLASTAAAIDPTGAEARGAPVHAAQRALHTAARAVPHGKPFDLELEHHRGQRVWEVKVASTHGRQFNVIVRRGGRRVVARRQARRADDDARKARRARVGARRALRIASRRASGRFKKLEIDGRRGGRLVWEIELTGDDRSEVEIVVDARTGRVRTARHETDEHD